MIQIAPLTLTTPSGVFEFVGAEVPDQVPFGGEHLVAVHQLIGGARIVDAMGASDAPLTWKGWLLGASAEDRARFLDSIRRAGDQCTLTWSDYSYAVVVTNFSADYQKPHRIPYTITCTVVQDRTQLVINVPRVTPSQAVAMDSQTITLALPATGLVYTPVQTAVSALQAVAQPMAQGLQPVGAGISAAARTVDGFAQQVTTAAQAIVGPLATFATQVGNSIVQAEGATMEIATLGGVAPAGQIAQRVGQIIAGANAQANLPSFYQMSHLANRMSTNLGAVANPQTRQQIIVGGGTLYGVAAQVYGDATQWQQIAQANGLSDPNLSGITQLSIP
ncbi:MAG: hypothetical protein B7Z80_10360 [Rhodospirillales bacterium 20-64-7]|nr:MAG: hypothetical protein B7Z80_10360 [Rhodospirillales bacterium 20-64-7]